MSLSIKSTSRRHLCQSETHSSASGISPGHAQTANARLVVHGGAGLYAVTPEKAQQYREAIRDALYAGNDVLLDGGSALDAVVAAVAVLEDNPLFNAGKGACFNIAGKHELEASVAVSDPPKGYCLSTSRRGAGVTLLKHVKNPVKLARELYLNDGACPHVFLSGPDAERIADEAHLEMVDEHYFDTKAAWDEHMRGLHMGEKIGVYEATRKLHLPTGTVGAVALDAHGALAVATSTGGITNKNVGRIGDTPSMGSGFWCSKWTSKPNFIQRVVGKSNRRQGVAVSGTGVGDYYIRNAAAFNLESRMRLKGHSVARAATDVLKELEHQSPETGGFIAIDGDGKITMPCTTKGMSRGTIAPRDCIPLVAIWRNDTLETVT